MNNTQEQIKGLLKILAVTAIVTTFAAVDGMTRKSPVQINGVNYRGYKNDKESGVQLLYFGDQEAGIVNEARVFNVDKAYHQGGAYNVSGYRQWGNTYATNVTPVKADSPVKVEAE